MGSTLLDAYLTNHGMGYGAMARKLGKSRSTVWRWAKGLQTPGIADAIAIQKATNRQVRVSAWAQPDPSASQP